MSGHALVTGGTGFIGARLVDKLLEEGWRVTVLARPTSRLPLRHETRVEILHADLTQPLLSIPSGIDVVFHCAADMEVGRRRKEMAATTVEGTWKLVDAARRARAGRFVHVSSQAVYGFDRQYYDADETTPLRRSPLAYCETKRLAEEAVWTGYAEGLPVSVVRPGFVYGPGDRRTLPDIVRLLKAGQLTHHIDWGEFDTGCLHVDNCVQGIYLAGTVEAAVGEAFHLGDGRVLTIRQLVDSLAAGLGVPAPRKNLPYPLVLGLGYLVEGLWRALFLPGNPPLTPFLVQMVHRNSGFSIAKAKRLLGYRPLRQWEESLPETLRWCEEAIAGRAPAAVPLPGGA